MGNSVVPESPNNLSTIPRVHACGCKEETSIKHSALFDIQKQAGASFTEHHGWEVPAIYRSAESEAEAVRHRVGVADVSWMVKFDLKGYVLKKDFRLGEKVFCWPLGPLHLLATSDPADRGELLTQLKPFQTAGADLSLPPPVYVTDVTSVYSHFLLAGPKSREVLCKLSSLNVSDRSLPNLACGQSNVAHVRAIVLRQDLNSIPAFQLLVNREYGECVWESVVHAGQEFELEPFGLEPLALLKD
jgi:glycine cleavage system aminomethyltransferase T